MDSKIESAQELSKSHKAIVEEEIEEEQASVGCCEMFRFATCCDVVLMVIGTIAAMAMGTGIPAFAYLWGQMTDSFAADAELEVGKQVISIFESARESTLLFIYVALGVFVAGWLMYACWMIAGQRQAIALRKAYLNSLLKQQIGWFDLANQAELSSAFAADTVAFQNGISEKVPVLIMALSSLIAGFVFAFITGWLMSLVIVATLPLLALSGVFFMWSLSNKDKRDKETYQEAGGCAEQAIESIKTVKQLNGEAYETEKYEDALSQMENKKYGFLAGLAMGSIFFVMLGSYSLGFWFGSKCVAAHQTCILDPMWEKYSPGDVLVIFFSLLIAGFNINMVGPALKKITIGRTAASKIFPILDREPLIKNPPQPIIPKKFRGKIEFHSVTFSYPKDKNRIILKNFSAVFDNNQGALVGESGCGKSTVLQLIMRYYDPDEGKVTLDGHDLRDLDLGWLRHNIGYVGQEPVLFSTSIRENLLFGKEDATEEEIKEALKKAEAYDFIQQLEDKLETYVGKGGGQLSGGQKQRVAIARALLKNPKIMLFDEATSALDRRNERLIQETLNHVAEGRTSVTVAHRVETIRKSDVIYVVDKGEVVEKGKFNELHRYKDYKNPEQEQENMQKQENKLVTKEESMKEGKKQEVEMTKEEKEKKMKQEEEQMLKKYEDSIFGRIFSYSTDYIWVMIIGIIFALANGVIFPVFSLFLAKMMDVLFRLQIAAEIGIVDTEAEDESNRIALYFLFLGLGALICYILQMGIFNLVGDHITSKIRIQVFEKIMRMPIPWLEQPKNNSGALSARLAVDCLNVNTLTTSLISILIQSISTLIAGLVIGFIHDWATSLVSLGLLPIMMLAGALDMQYQAGFSQDSDDAYKDSSSLIMEALVNIRTVTSFGYDNVVTRKYEERLQKPESMALRRGNIAGILYGFSQFVMYIIFALVFYLGAVFIKDLYKPETPQELMQDVQNMYIAIFAVMFAAMTAGNNLAFMPDAGAAKNSAASLFSLLDSTDQTQIQTEMKSKMLKAGIDNTDISINNITFKYPSRTEYLFKNFSLKIQSGEKVAFVGVSGCGKSTITQLLLRFYDPEEGQITINGVDIREFDVHYLRSKFGVVSQEPVLFDASFEENIRYNLDNISDEKIIAATKKANAYKFIVEGGDQMEEKKVEEESGTLGRGFDRGVGIKGSHISGGQKQRVAIARAILREPTILLLDEATSALDQENERQVQASLDTIMKGKTSISIAHRISTIKNSNQIYVFGKGEIIEKGHYEELVDKKGFFYKLERGFEFL